MTNPTDRLRDLELSITWSRARDAPEPVRELLATLAAREPARFRELTRKADARLDLFIGDGRSLWADDRLVTHDPPDEGDTHG